MTKAAKVNERQIVLEILLAVTRDGAYCHLATADVLEKYQFLDKKSRAFITRLSAGTLERMIEIDYILDQFSKTPVRKMKPVIRCILRSGVYQLKYMDAVPSSAACNEAVRLAEKRGFGALKGFVNGVLRSIDRALQNDAVAYPDETTDFVHYAGIHYSLPEWIVQLWVEQRGVEETKQICENLYTRTATAIRVNTNRTTKEALTEELAKDGITVTESDLVEDAFYISGYDYLQALPAFHAGDFYVQDVSSMLSVLAAGIKPGDEVVDVCAAPGGKAIYAAQLLEHTGHVQARDLTDHKVELIEENIDRCQMDNMDALVWDATIPDETIVGAKDVVIADLPCSGLGILRKKPDIRFHQKPEQLQELAQLQREILSVVQAYTKSGGTLVFSTCTINRGENEDNTAWFLENYPMFQLQEEKQLLVDEQHDGFYYAVFRRR